MHEIMKAIDIALRNTPQHKAPGLNGVLFDFVGASGSANNDKLYMYASDGYTMIRLIMENVGIGVTGRYFVDVDGLREIYNKSKDADNISLSVWENDFMIMTGDIVDTLQTIECGIEDGHKDLFSRTPQGAFDDTFIDMDRLCEVVMRCEPILLGFKKSGPAIRVNFGKKMIIISPKINPNLKHIKSVDIVIAEMELERC